MRSSIFLLGFVLAFPLCAQESPKAVPELKKEELCSVAGIVIDAADSAPLKKARVSLDNPEMRGHSYFTFSGADGKFKLEGVAPGRYTLSVSRNGFVDQKYGQKSPEGQGAVLALEPRQKLSDLVFKLIRSSVISGRVLDEDGEPMPRVTVQALRLSYHEGQKQFLPEARAETDDRGEYRLFDLEPGGYYLNASAANGALVFDTSRVIFAGEPRPRMGYAPVYYPGGADPSQAAQVQVGPGEEVPSIDFLFFPVRTFRLRGRVVSSIPEQTGRGVMVWLEGHGKNALAFVDRRATSVTDEQGSFEIEDVPSGSYALTGLMSASGKRYSAQIPVDIGNADVEGITLVIGPGIDLPGHIQIEGSDRAQFNELGVSLQPVPGSRFSGAGSLVKPDGTFLLRNVSEAEYRVALRGQPDRFYLKSARLGTDDVLNKPLVVKQGGTHDTLELTLSSGAASVRGHVLNDDSLPVPAARVALVPEPSQRDQLRLYRAATTYQFGKFILRGIAPGDYKIFAWEEIEQGAWQDPDFIHTYEDKGRAIQLGEGADQSVELRVIRAKQSSQNP